MYLNGLKSLTIPASVKDITSYGIHACRELESVTMLGERPSVPGSVLWGCDKAKVYVPVDAKSWAGMKTWQNRTLVFGPKWNYEVKDGEIILGGNGRTAVPTAMKGDLVIPATIDGKPVRKIGCRAFRDCQALTSVTIPEGVTSFEGEAFRNCSELTTVNVPSSVTNVHGSAFIDCKAFAKFSVDPCNPVYCSKNDMLCTKDGSKVVFGVIGDVTIPDGVESIEIHAFSGFRGLRSVQIPKSVKVIGEGAFRNCGMLKSVEIPYGVQNIGEGAFACCGMLTSVEIPSSVTYIGPGSFGGCGLKSVTVPSSVTNMGCSVFCWCKEMTSATIMANISSIEANAFNMSEKLMSVVIPPSVKSIGHCAFQFGQLESITIPENVIYISDRAFDSCRKLQSVIMLGERPDAPKDIFPRCPKEMVIHVPANAKSWAGMTEWQGKKLVFDAKDK